METALVALIVGGAALSVGRRAWRLVASARRKQGGAGCGGGCGCGTD